MFAHVCTASVLQIGHTAVVRLDPREKQLDASLGCPRRPKRSIARPAQDASHHVTGQAQHVDERLLGEVEPLPPPAMHLHRLPPTRVQGKKTVRPPQLVEKVGGGGAEDVFMYSANPRRTTLVFP